MCVSLEVKQNYKEGAKVIMLLVSYMAKYDLLHINLNADLEVHQNSIEREFRIAILLSNMAK